MVEKIKRILLMRSIWFFIIFLLLLLISFWKYLVHRFGAQAIEEGFTGFFNWHGWNNGIWEAISAFVLAITARVLYLQAKETRKSTRYLEYQTKPMAHFLILKSMNVDWAELWIKNESRFKIYFYIRIILKSNNKILKPSIETYWKKENPLHVYPSQKYRLYPYVIDLSGITPQQSPIIAEIEYELAPSHAPSERYKNYYKEEWKYVGGFWRGPNGIEENGVRSLLLEK